MKYYSDQSNDTAANVLFMFFQIFILLIVYGFVYTSFVAVKMAIANYGLTFMTYLPEVVVLVCYPVVMFRTMKAFKQGKRLRSIAWILSCAAVSIVFLYGHLSQLIPE